MPPGGECEMMMMPSGCLSGLTSGAASSWSVAAGAAAAPLAAPLAGAGAGAAAGAGAGADALPLAILDARPKMRSKGNGPSKSLIGPCDPPCDIEAHNE